ITAVGAPRLESGGLVERNVISGGCGTISASGIVLEEAYSRIENNLISGGGCDNVGGNPPQKFVGVSMRVSSVVANEPDVHSNTIDGGGAQVACESNAVEVLALGAT